MVRATNLTDAKLQGLKPSTFGQLEISDTLVPGLRIRVGTSGIRTFIVRKRAGGKMRNITLGRFGPRLGLAEARKRARMLLSDIEAGKVPSTATRRSPKESNTVRALWPAYKAEKAKLRTIGEVERVFNRYVLPAIGDRFADAVTRGDVTRMIDAIADSAPVMARNVLAQLSAFYSWALPRLDKLPANPCRDAGRPAKPPPRDRVLAPDELRALWQVAEADAWPWGPALQLLILTGQRRGEVFDAEWSEFDLKTNLWTIPAGRAKNGVAHLVPLSSAAVTIIKALPRQKGSEKLFPAMGNPEASTSGIGKAVPRWRKAMLANLQRSSGGHAVTVAHWRLHDVRRTVATGLQRIGVRIEVTEAVLNHISGSRAGIVGVYQRYDFAIEKRHALDAWSDELLRLAMVWDSNLSGPTGDTR